MQKLTANNDSIQPVQFFQDPSRPLEFHSTCYYIGTTSIAAQPGKSYSGKGTQFCKITLKYKQ